MVESMVTSIGLLGIGLGLWVPLPTMALPREQPTAEFPLDYLAESPVTSLSSEQLDLDPHILESSPVLQRWLEAVPDVLSDIQSDPSFRTRVRLGYTQDWSDDAGGIAVGIEDIFLGRSRLTLSGDYQARFAASDQQYGADLRYHVLPLGNAVNIAPVLGYRHISREKGVGRDQSIEGMNVGLRLIFVPSRTGAADISLTQTWTRPGSDRFSVSRFTLSAGYALTQTLRLSTDFRIETNEQDQTTETGLLLEWML